MSVPVTLPSLHASPLEHVSAGGVAFIACQGLVILPAPSMTTSLRSSIVPQHQDGAVVHPDVQLAVVVLEPPLQPGEAVQ